MPWSFLVRCTSPRDLKRQVTRVTRNSRVLFDAARPLLARSCLRLGGSVTVPPRHCHGFMELNGLDVTWVTDVGQLNGWAHQEVPHSPAPLTVLSLSRSSSRHRHYVPVSHRPAHAGQAPHRRPRSRQRQSPGAGAWASHCVLRVMAVAECGARPLFGRLASWASATLSANPRPCCCAPGARR